MHPDERLRRQLQGADEHAFPDPEFMAALFDRLLVERPRSRRWLMASPRSSRSIRRVASAAAAAIIVATLGAIWLGSREGPGPATSPSAPSITTPSASPSTSASAAPSQRTATPRPSFAAPSPTTAAQAAIAALNVVDKAITAARGPAGLNLADQNRLFQLEDGIRPALERGDLTAARTVFDQLAAYVLSAEARLDSDGGRRLKSAVTGLDVLLPKP